MFGYIKIHKEELLVKDYNLYRALYCGLCRTIKKKVSFFIPFSLSYDFVFLAVVRDILTGEKPTAKQGRCSYNPLKKKSFISSEGINFTSLASLILIEKNIEDKRRDGDFKILSPLLFTAHGYLKRKIKEFSKDENFASLYKEVSEKLDNFSKLEKSGACADELCESFGEVMASLLSHGLDSHEKRIAKATGSAIGSWLYLADAVDDCGKDFKKGHFNPLINDYKTPAGVKENARDIDIAFASFAKDAHLALSLAPESVYSEIIENIVTKGLGLEAYNIFSRLGGNNDGSI